MLQSEKMKYAYEVMQQYAHGIEYIIQDQIAAGISKQFLAKFNDVRTFLKAVSLEKSIEKSIKLLNATNSIISDKQKVVLIIRRHRPKQLNAMRTISNGFS